MLLQIQVCISKMWFMLGWNPVLGYSLPCTHNFQDRLCTPATLHQTSRYRTGLPNLFRGGLVWVFHAAPFPDVSSDAHTSVPRDDRRYGLKNEVKEYIDEKATGSEASVLSQTHRTDMG